MSKLLLTIFLPGRLIIFLIFKLYQMEEISYFCGMEKLKIRWGISSNWQLLIILLVFSITGSSSVYLAKPVLGAVGVVRDSFHDNFWLGALPFYLLRILLIFPLYQLLLIFFGWIFGQFNFFWNFEKKMLKRMGFGKFFPE